GALGLGQGLGQAGPVAAQTATVIDQAVSALRKGDPVYVDPAAERPISAARAEALRRRIRAGKRSVFVAVLPQRAVAEAGGDPNEVPTVVYRRLGFAGTYAVVAGDSFRASSSDLAKGQAARLATTAFADNRARGVDAVLAAFVESVEGAGSGASRGVPLVPVGGAAVLGMAVGAGLWWLVRRARGGGRRRGDGRRGRVSDRADGA
ncbi:MAG: hypothetical protein QOI20_1470, partial [Acidimicrobiaceae bacterium]|nr:hypothetical protein [Acidimicrobiaceae bacterium]